MGDRTPDHQVGWHEARVRAAAANAAAATAEQFWKVDEQMSEF